MGLKSSDLTPIQSTSPQLLYILFASFGALSLSYWKTNLLQSTSIHTEKQSNFPYHDAFDHAQISHFAFIFPHQKELEMASSLINKPVNPKSYFLLEFALPSVCTFLPILTIPSIGYGQTGLFFFLCNSVYKASFPESTAHC